MCRVSILASEKLNYTHDSWLVIPITFRDFNKEKIIFGGTPRAPLIAALSSTGAQVIIPCITTHLYFHVISMIKIRYIQTCLIYQSIGGSYCVCLMLTENGICISKNLFIRDCLLQSRSKFLQMQYLLSNYKY